MLVDEALDGLLRTLRSIGAAEPAPPSDLEDLKRLKEEIAPMRLPADVRRFWERIDINTMPIETYPGWHGPDFALTSWRMSRDEFSAAQPLALVQIAYTSHQCMSVELDFGDHPGGALFEWNVVDGDFERRFNGIAEWLAYARQLIEAGNFRRDGAPRGRYLRVPDPDRWDEEGEQDMPAAPAPHPVYGDTTTIGRDILDWPERWQRSAGLRAEDLVLRGATHTVGELLASPPEQSVRATILAQVVDLAGGSNWARVRVDDRTGRLDVFCPAGTTLLGPRSGDWYEFDIAMDTGARVVPADPDAAAAQAATAGADDAERLAAMLYARYGGPAGATAEAIRRADPPAPTS